MTIDETDLCWSWSETARGPIARSRVTPVLTLALWLGSYVADHEINSEQWLEAVQPFHVGRE
jgi:hypothetical protein